MKTGNYGTIMCDLDGVLVNWDKEVEHRLHMTPKQLDDTPRSQSQKLLAQACDSVDFWANLEPMPDYSTLWGYIKYWSPSILTAYPKWAPNAKEIAIRGKHIWNKHHTMVPDSRFHVVAREDKQKFALNSGKPNILIDDTARNIEEFERAGGVGIHHKGAVSTIIQLKRLGYVK